jgi:hypothetical protein
MDQIAQNEIKRIWFHRFDEATSFDALAALDEELVNLDLPSIVAGPIRIKSIVRRQQLAKANAVASEPAKMANFAARYGLPASDGRPLYAYRLTDKGFADLTADLIGKELAYFESGYGSGLFALWAAEWFRREYSGGFFTWAGLVGPLALAPEQNRLRDITRKGLLQWQRPVLSLNGRQFIGTLAREGGFPAAAMQESGRGWARDVLERIVGPLLAISDPDAEQALELAKGAQDLTPGLFRDDSFLEVCADLALAIVRLRRKAEPEAAKAQLPISAWLHLHRPGWTQELPLTTGDKVAEALVEYLLKVEPVATQGLEIARVLVKDGAVWREALKLGLDGMVRGDAMGVADPRDGRLRAFPAGLLARYLSGELAMFDPPGLGDKEWQVRSSRLGRALHEVPFSVPVAFDLRSGERIISRFEPKLGKPRRGQLLVAVCDAGGDDAPISLRIVGSGSGVYRADPIYVRLPADWRVQTVGQEAALHLGSCVDGQAVWRLSGGATIIDDTGDLYRLRCGQAADETHRLDLIGDHVAWAEVSGNVDLYQGAPKVMVLGVGELVLRGIGTRAWQKAPQPLPVGHYEVGWRHGKELLDRRRLAVLPKGALLERNGRGNSTRYTPEGLDDVTLTPLDGGPVRVTAQGHWSVIANGPIVHHFTARIDWPDGPPLDVSIAFPCAASIASWNGQVLPNNSTFTLDDLPDLVAVDEGAMELVGELRGDRADSAEMSWLFDQSMPLSAIAEDMVDLMMQSNSLESSVRLGMHDGIETYWNVRQFAVTLRKEGHGIVAYPAIVAPDAVLCGRCFGDPTNEQVLAPYSLFNEANHRPVALPTDMGGLWIVYLRDGDRVLTRPQYITGPSVEPAAVSALGQVMALPLGPVLNKVLREFLDIAQGDSDDAYGHVMELVDLAVSLRGLPPSTFEIFKSLSGQPTALARMLLCAPPAARDAVYRLARALPFAWYLVPHASWQAAQRLVFENVLAQMANLPEDLQGRAMEFAASAVGEATRDLSSRSPLAGAILQPKAEISLEEAAQAFLRRGRERIREDHSDRYRRHLGTLLPSLFEKFDPVIRHALDAPCAAALAALGVWQPSQPDVRHIKTIARSFPTWFSEAFTAILVEHM